MAARTRSFDGLHGFLADSLPDGWGYLLMRKRLAKLGIDIAALTPLERLALVGDHGRGALVFKPATTPADDVETLDLDALAHDATALLMGEESRLADTLAGLAGGSGGARPKVHVGFDGQGHISVGQAEMPAGHAAWLVKFRAPSDPIDIGPIEEAYACMAEAAGLTISSHRLLPAKSARAISRQGGSIVRMAAGGCTWCPWRGRSRRRPTYRQVTTYSCARRALSRGGRMTSPPAIPADGFQCARLQS